VAYPKVDAEPYERRDGILFDDPAGITVMHYGCYKILESISSNFAPDNLQFLKLLSWINTHLFFLIEFSIDRRGFKLSEYCSGLTAFSVKRRLTV
jgi:hypothetical protein